MAEIQAKIDRLEAEIEEIKVANKKWASNAGDKAAISAARQQIVALEARLASGILPNSHSHCILTFNK
jgi:hypothetical protein